MKDYIWVVEVDFGDGWSLIPNWTVCAKTRRGARVAAARVNATGFKTRVRKYQRVGK